MKPELLSPAGTLKNMRYAFAYGADAVYAGQPRYSLRVRNNEFTHDNLAKGIAEAHALGKKFYVVVNIAPHNAKLKTFIRDLTPVVEMQPDALIMSDPGLIMLVREAFPQMPIHLSVQANAVNWATVKFWQQMGLTRVILSRELSLEEIAEIRQQVPEMEIEIFVHGALCMAYSGRCLLSGYMNKRDPNQGTCTNACRWEYKVEEGKQDEAGNIVEVQEVTPTLGLGQPTDKVFLLEEKMKPGEVMSAFEDEHGTYIMNSKDLRAVAHVERLSAMGVHSLKIEGRTKSFYYCARTAQVYRRAIDDAAAGKPFDPELLTTLEGLAHRGYTEGFLRRHTHDSYQNYAQGYSISERQQFVGEFTGERRGDWAEVAVKNKFLLGDSLEIMTPNGNLNCRLEAMQDARGAAIDVAPGDGHRVWIPVPADVGLAFGLLLRNFTDGSSTRDPHSKLLTSRK
ncbi:MULTISPECIES: prephenate-dependent tRNA uridine(34) hydroxylase TrhP [Pantoea]|jgi:putative protease|uniref:tRNA 5-hydroxyuridine modification protein YegQ n=1 Tax=Pantoea piersonii TaxID=2364647 RepID=A0AAJ5QLF8_9GAMM|nr:MULTISPECIES: tRNA 5-hydroxyuridine modification protein YegQ [Pantoea]MDU6434848.1 tRNA 5-hydroxyuridine modification protein YegQ [Pantoea sp.]MBZ6384992.1 tRNA 5-hydroxyuridine modification protein YegQ [Pantoea piersonii]MBZ6398872.1 tRNA 5-hydroxyuridine modification protein YegQ [Pantoea piersonii]MBZ6408484.1 tRNA 5-hydroxyuridine modification protein YegQ [Pantoea piersonii]MBZ6426157.1 tRNA 5-hydroxyuridine modification protein YegQ [Pantoea piersonii]